jgi:hypothetical protein
MSGFYRLNDPCEWRASHTSGGLGSWNPPEFRIIHSINVSNVEDELDVILRAPELRVLGISPAIPTPYGERLTRWTATVLYQERVSPNGGAVDDSE